MPKPLLVHSEQDQKLLAIEDESLPLSIYLQENGLPWADRVILFKDRIGFPGDPAFTFTDDNNEKIWLRDGKETIWFLPLFV